MLRVQRRYGSGRPIVRGSSEAAFGIDLYPAVPEDAFDRQPLMRNGRLLVADIRIDNRDELVAALDISAERQLADSEILLEAWLRWDEAALDRIVGDFALAIFDIRYRKLILARDIVGERPLFFAQRDGNVGFSSMPSGLLAVKRFRRGFDLDALGAAAADMRPSGDCTYFSGVHRVLPGQMTVITEGDVKASDHWTPNLTELSLDSTSAYVEACRDVLDSAVEARLRRTGGRVGTHLSSGLDSSAVASTAARLKRSEKMLAFTAAPKSDFKATPLRGRIADESSIACVTARLYDMEHHIVRSGGSGISRIRELVKFSQEPQCNIINLGWAKEIEELAHDLGAGVLLSGEFGNLTLNAGGLSVLADLIARNRWRLWWHEARSAVSRRDVRWSGVLINSFEPWLPGPLKRTLYRWRFSSGARSQSPYLTKPWLAKLRGRLEREFLADRSGDSYVDRMRFLPLTESGTLRKGSLATHGIDNRSPLGDRRIIEFSLRLPREQLFSNGISRPLAAAALSDRLPPEVLSQSVRGYQAADWFSTFDLIEVGEMVDEIAQNPTACELIDVERLRRTIKHWPRDGFERFGVYQQLAGDLPAALSTGMFIIEAEKWLAGQFD